MATVVEPLCSGCGICMQVCPVGAITTIAKLATIDKERCEDCEECIFACPNGAIGG